jgi:hypothetical protein
LTMNAMTATTMLAGGDRSPGCIRSRAWPG